MNLTALMARGLAAATLLFSLPAGAQENEATADALFTAGQFDKKWGVFAAGALIGALPIMITYLALQDQIAGGLTAGAVKE